MIGSGYILNDDSRGTGRSLLLSAEWNPSILTEFDSSLVTELSLSRGFYGTDISFLTLFENVSRLAILTPVHSGLDSLYSLQKLNTLVMAIAPREELEFTRLPYLRDCNIEWWSGAKSILRCSSLESLRVEKIKESDLGFLSELTSLRRLWISQSRIVSMSGIEKLSNLTELTLVALGSLATFDQIAACRSLESLTFYRCTRLAAISFLSGLTNLQRLTIENCGMIDSINVLERLEQLVALTIDGSTDIEDGDLECLLKCPKLANLVLKPRKHYNMRRSDFYQKRWPNQDWAKNL